MRNMLALGLCLYISVFTVSAKYVDPEVAKRVGANFLHSNLVNTFDLPALQLAYTYRSSATLQQAEKPLPYIYVFNAGSRAFVMVAADDAVEPILGYSDNGIFNTGKVPENAMKFFEGYRAEIRYVIVNGIKPTKEISEAWAMLLDDNPASVNQASGVAVVAPLLRTTWNQAPYYNSLCPYDRDRNTRAVTGCVATSMAQIMKYWNYPTKGSGFFSYNHNKYGTLSANFGATTYSWSSMPNALTSNNTAVATLMYHCGVSVEMEYGVDASSAYPNKMANALKTYFGYASTTRYVEKGQGYTDAQWVALMKAELDASRPVNYAGNGGGGGHSFVCDGYDVNNKFHINWGWGGSDDGYFTLNALNPASLGIGGGTGGFNNNARAIIGIAPPTPPAQTLNMTLYSALSVSPDPVPYGNAFSVTTNLANFGTATFSGDYCVALFDDSLNFVDYVETKTGNTLGSNMAYQNSLTFSKSGSFSLLPGNYSVSLFYRPTNGQWQAVNSTASLTNVKQLKIVNTNNIRLYSSLTATPSTLVKGQPVSVNFNILNNGNSTFVGQYSAGLYKMDGNGVQTIGTYNETAGLPPQYVYQAPYITLSQASVTAEPGTYLLAIQHKPNGSSSWQLTGTGDFQNPIKVVVRSPALTADAFEPNNTTLQPYTFVPVYAADTSMLLSEGANCHIVNDYDYYRVNFPTGYNYTVTPRLHDSYAATNGKTYTLDALFSYSFDGTTWSDAFDDVLPAPLSIPGGSNVYFKVAPYFAGGMGTYLLDIRMKRTVVTSVSNLSSRFEIRVFPNPTNKTLFIGLEGALQVGKWRYELSDMSGRQLAKMENLGKTTLIRMDTYPRGVYLLRVYRGSMLVRTEHVIRD